MVQDNQSSDQHSDQHFVLLGKVGAGKSASGNTILGRKGFISRKAPGGVTRACATDTINYRGLNVVVHDTPGFCDPDLSDEEIEQKIRRKILHLPSHGNLAFLLVLKIDRFTPEEQNTVRRIERLLGEERLKRTWILFTRGDDLEDQTILDHISESKDLKKVMVKYRRRYHVFNNKSGHKDQVKSLLENVRPSYSEPPRSFPIPDENLPERRLVLLGKSGWGKSATGNTILGGEYFKSKSSMSSVTQTTQVEQAAVNGKKVCVVDTPGLFDTRLSDTDQMLQFANSIYVCAPGPHAFLIVMPVSNRFTEQEKRIIDIYQALFGPRLADHAIILFTHGDQMEGTTVEQLVKESKDLTELIEQCGGRYQLFNNKDASNRVQVKQLMDKIENMLESSGGSCYTSEMFEAAARAAEEAQREEEERERQEAEERERREEERKENERRRIVKETEERCRSEYKKADKERAGQEAEERERREEEQKENERRRIVKETEERCRSEYEKVKERAGQKAEEREQDRKAEEEEAKSYKEDEKEQAERNDGDNSSIFSKLSSGFRKFWSLISDRFRSLWSDLRSCFFRKSDDSEEQPLIGKKMQ